MSLLLLLIILLILIFVIFNSFGFLTGAPFAATPKKAVEEVFGALKIGKGEVVFDLGAGDGVILREALKRGARVVGVEINPLLWVYLKFRFWDEKDVKIIWGSFWGLDISEATVVFAFLLPETVKRLEKKFDKELRPKSLVLTYLGSLNKPIFKRVGRVNAYRF